jgi:hypothetical protein
MQDNIAVISLVAMGWQGVCILADFADLMS